MELAIFFWYGLLHAFSPDHLSAIADFSIGKNRRKTFLITLLFAFGHGLMLFVFAKVLEYQVIDFKYLQYADTVAALIIASMGAYMILMVALNRVHLKKHIHHDEEHIHIWFGSEHNHSQKSNFSALTVGALMGIGGARGMILVLGITSSVSLDIIGAFVAGVSVVFLVLGFFISIFNTSFLSTKESVRAAVLSIGGISLLVGMNMLGGV